MTPLVECWLRVEPTALALRCIGDWLRSATDRTGLADPGGLLPRAELAVHEACMNVVDHADLPPGGVIELRLRLVPRELCLKVVDRGTEFRIAEVAAPVRGVAQERGYGLSIIRALVDDLTYRRTGSTNELELTLSTGART